MEEDSDHSVSEFDCAAHDLEAASLWINAVNDTCTIQTDEFVGHSVDIANEKGVASGLSWTNCRAGFKDYNGLGDYQDFTWLNGRLKRSTSEVHSGAINNNGGASSLEDAFDMRERRGKEETENQEDFGAYMNGLASEGYTCTCKGATSLGKSRTTPTGSKRVVQLRECSVPCLNSINELKTCFGSKYELHLNVHKGKAKLNKYKFKKELLVELEEWEAELNECSRREPYIAVENKVDNARPPKDFEYISHSIIPLSVNHLFDKDYLVGCSCVRCTPLHCECPHNHGGEFAYDHFGRIQFKPGKPVYECNAQCACSVTCRNRVVQRGRTVKVAIFRTPNGCGWGVKTMEPIQKNQFVTEYVGELITNEEAEKRGKQYDAEGQTYLFDLDYNDGDCQYTLDAKRYGNISHFINHSCDPNLNVYGVWCDTLDPALPRIALFASCDIAAGEELSFDYLMTAEDNSSSSHKTKRIKCGCGSKDCRKYLY